MVAGCAMCIVEQPARQLETGVRKGPLKARRKRQYEKKSPHHHRPSPTREISLIW